MLEATYGHLGTVRHRAAAVEYRVEQHTAKLKDRLSRLFGIVAANSAETEDRKSLRVVSSAG